MSCICKRCGSEQRVYWGGIAICPHCDLGEPLDDVLKPCPFCGDDNALLESYPVRKGFEATISCNGCGCKVHSIITFDEEEDAVKTVVKNWNRRK